VGNRRDAGITADAVVGHMRVRHVPILRAARNSAAGAHR
jgi:hypothetical protein